MAEQKDYLTELDSAIGDADHGINMNRGMQAVLGKLDAQPNGDVGALFKTVGMTLVSTVGGAAGPLYGTLFLQLGVTTAGKAELTEEDWAAALAAAVDGCAGPRQGRARRQDDGGRADPGARRLRRGGGRRGVPPRRAPRVLPPLRRTA